MRRLSIFVSSLLLITTTAFGATRSIDDPGPSGRQINVPVSRHFILSPARLLNEQEQADLASRGLVIEKPLAGGRFLVRLSANATVTENDPRIASLTPLTANQKLHRSAVREITSGKPYAHLNVLFHDDVTFSSAKAAIEAAGGTLTEVLQQDFHQPRRISIVIPSSAVSTLAADESVLLVSGPMHLQIAPDNLEAASLSNVTLVQAAPYNLNGQGVALSYFELAIADASHPEFGGRLTTHVTGGDTSDQQHATHTGGTMIAAGIDPSAKGMAPVSTLNEFDANDDNFLDLKANLPSFLSVADNNSWGYILGWCNTGTDCPGWTWTGTDIYYGAYDSIVTAPLDQLTRSTGVLMVHSAGNDAQKLGPQSPPFAHYHQDDNGNPVNGYCYSADGSGTDCPSPCKSGATFCETMRHPQITDQLPAPWLSIGVTAVAKDVIAVGAVDATKQIAGFSSRGPTRDGRVKPDLVAQGVGVYSTIPNDEYTSMSGTSMSAPVVTGTAALLVEQWKRMFGNVNPGPAVLKTIMIATAQDLGNPGPDYTYGFGLLDAKAAVDTMVADAGQSRRIHLDQLATGAQLLFPLTVTSTQNLRVVVGWSDPEVLVFPVDSGDPTDPLAAATLVNQIDLKVTDPGGNDVLPYILDPTHPDTPATRGVNHVDNIQEVEIANAAPGTYRVVVNGTSITASSPQAFVLVSNADLGPAVLPCTDPYEPNDSEATAYGNVVSTQSLTGRTCTATNVDYFKFVVDTPGTVSVTVTATDTPLSLTLSSSATQSVTATIAAGGTQTVSTAYDGTTPTTFYARIETPGPVGLIASYTITPTFPSAETGRRRSVHP